ncbi:MAG: hypothetical protein ACTSRS_14075 [Candidatus Helarchaeota archaeon]
MDHVELAKKLRTDPQNIGEIIWNTLTPFERERVFKRIQKNAPVSLEKSPPKKPDPVPIKVEPPKVENIPSKTTTNSSSSARAELPPSETSSEKSSYERSIWDLKTLYQVAHADMIEQRCTIMKFLLMNYGIEAVEDFFLRQNPEWSEQLKVGKMKKIFAKLISKLMPKMILNKLSDIIIENAQYLVPLDHIVIDDATDNYKLIHITKCPVLKQFKKTIKTLKFHDLEERYVCSFACVPVLAQMAAVGNCCVSAEYIEKGCQLRVSLKPKEPEILELTEEDSIAEIRNGTSR